MGSTAMLSHSIGYRYLGVVSGNFCRNVNRSIRVLDRHNSVTASSGSFRNLYPSPSTCATRHSRPWTTISLPQKFNSDNFVVICPACEMELMVIEVWLLVRLETDTGGLNQGR